MVVALWIDSTVLPFRLKETREIVQNMLVMTRKHKNATVESKEWRMEVSYRALMLLRTSVAVFEFPSSGVAAWQVPELGGTELECCTPSASWRRHEQTTPTEESDSQRVPMLMAYLLRESISSQGERLSHPLSEIQEAALLKNVATYMSGYYSLVSQPCTNCSCHSPCLGLSHDFPSTFSGRLDFGVYGCSPGDTHCRRSLCVYAALGLCA